MHYLWLLSWKQVHKQIVTTRIKVSVMVRKVRTISVITLCIVFMLVEVVPIYAYDKAKVDCYIREAEYYTKQAESFDRDAAYYTRQAQRQMKDAEYYSKRGNDSKVKTCMRWAKVASDRAALRIRRAKEARDKARLRMKWAEDEMKRK